MGNFKIYFIILFIFVFDGLYAGNEDFEKNIPNTQGIVKINTSQAIIKIKDNIISFNCINGGLIKNIKLPNLLKNDQLWFYYNTTKDFLFFISNEKRYMYELSLQSGKAKELFSIGQRISRLDDLIFIKNRILWVSRDRHNLIAYNTNLANFENKYTWRDRTIVDIIPEINKNSLWVLFEPFDQKDAILLSRINLENQNEEIILKHTKDWIASNVVITGRKAFLFVGDNYDKRRVYLYDLANNNILWKSAVIKYPSTCPLVLKTNLLIYSADSILYAFDIKSGMLNWQYKFSNIAYTHPVSDGEYIYVMPLSIPNIYIISDKGKLKAIIKLDNFVLTQPVIFNNILLVKDKSGMIYAIDTNNHKIKWKKAFTSINSK